MLDQAVLRQLVEAATLAPSSHNSQPWWFQAGERTLDLWADRTRALPVCDPHDRELTISCGAALMSLRVAAAAAGLATTTTLLPDPGEPDWMARVEFIPGAADADLAALAHYLPERRTYRRAFAAQPVAESARQCIESAVLAEQGRLQTLDEAAREAAAALVGEGDRAQWDDPRWRRELAMWMHPRRAGDGLTVPMLAAPIAQAVVRSFDMGQGVAARDQQLLQGSPWLTVLTTETDQAADWLRAGQALQRGLLSACSLQLQAAYLNQPIEVEALRGRLRALLPIPQVPQLLLRWGHPVDAIPASPRRPVDAVLGLPAG